jgi:hypothetical protein
MTTDYAYQQQEADQPDVHEAHGAADTDTAAETDADADAATSDDDIAGNMIAADETSMFQARLQEIQVSFIDDPRQAARDAGDLLAVIAETFCTNLEGRHHRLASATEREADPQTEELRLAMRQYRTLIDSLLDF